MEYDEYLEKKYNENGIRFSFSQETECSFSSNDPMNPKKTILQKAEENTPAGAASILYFFFHNQLLNYCNEVDALSKSCYIFLCVFKDLKMNVVKLSKPAWAEIMTVREVIRQVCIMSTKQPLFFGPDSRNFRSIELYRHILPLQRAIASLNQMYINISSSIDTKQPRSTIVNVRLEFDPENFIQEVIKERRNWCKFIMGTSSNLEQGSFMHYADAYHACMLETICSRMPGNQREYKMSSLVPVSPLENGSKSSHEYFIEPIKILHVHETHLNDFNPRKREDTLILEFPSVWEDNLGFPNEELEFCTSKTFSLYTLCPTENDRNRLKIRGAESYCILFPLKFNDICTDAKKKKMFSFCADTLRSPIHRAVLYGAFLYLDSKNKPVGLGAWDIGCDIMWSPPAEIKPSAGSKNNDSSSTRSSMEPRKFVTVLSKKYEISTLSEPQKVILKIPRCCCLCPCNKPIIREQFCIKVSPKDKGPSKILTRANFEYSDEMGRVNFDSSVLYEMYYEASKESEKWENISSNRLSILSILLLNDKKEKELAAKAEGKELEAEAEGKELAAEAEGENLSAKPKVKVKIDTDLEDLRKEMQEDIERIRFPVSQVSS
eukprot:snap_masked-scaffold_45-processed-gene-1.55-mRNA-1 protein AED:1.00 eAED:1.00 QI:0/-1/0/0/-1/1/1/0/605